MKKLIIVVLFLSACYWTQAQGNKITVPIKVRNSFWGIFPQAQNEELHPVKWEKTGINYKGTISVMDAPAVALIDTSGRVLRVELKIHELYLPDNVKTYLKTNYKDSKVKSILKVTDDKGKETYNIKLEINPVFDMDGKLLRVEK